MARRKRRLKQISDGPPIDLNVMPFIDVFSLLTTFLLFVAVFTHIGILEVQVPFLSNQLNKDKDQTKPKRSITVHVTLDNNTIAVESFFLDPPTNQKTQKFNMSEPGIAQMHNYLTQLRRDHPTTDKLSLFPTDDVDYESIVAVIDAIKFLKDTEPPISTSLTASEDEEQNAQNSLYPKVIIGNVLF